MNPESKTRSLEESHRVVVALKEKPVSSEKLAEWLRNEMESYNKKFGFGSNHFYKLLEYLQTSFYSGPQNQDPPIVNKFETRPSGGFMDELQEILGRKKTEPLVDATEAHDKAEGEFHKEEVVFTTKENVEMIVSSYRFTRRADEKDPNKFENAEILELHEPGFSQMCNEVYDEMVMNRSNSDQPLRVENSSHLGRVANGVGTEGSEIAKESPLSHGLTIH